MSHISYFTSCFWTKLKLPSILSHLSPWLISNWISTLFKTQIHLSRATTHYLEDNKDGPGQVHKEWFCKSSHLDTQATASRDRAPLKVTVRCWLKIVNFITYGHTCPPCIMKRLPSPLPGLAHYISLNDSVFNEVFPHQGQLERGGAKKSEWNSSGEVTAPTHLSPSQRGPWE